MFSALAGGKSGSNIVPLQIGKTAFSVPVNLTLGSLQADYFRQSGIQSEITSRNQLEVLKQKSYYEDLLAKRKLRSEIGAQLVSNATRNVGSSGSSLDQLVDSAYKGATEIYTQRYINEQNIQTERFKMENARYLGESRAKLFEIGSYIKTSGSLFKDVIRTSILTKNIGKVT